MLAAMSDAHNSVDVMRSLIAAKAYVDFKHPNRDEWPTALFYAAANGSKDKVKALIAAKAHLHIMYKDVSTAVDLAKAKGHRDIVKLLLDAKALPRETWQRMYDACAQGRADEVKTFLLNGYPLDLDDDRCKNPLLRAAANSHTDIVRMLIAARADVNVDSKVWDSPVFSSIKKGNVDILISLIAAEATVNEPETSIQESALHCAARYGNAIAAKVLIKAKANINHEAGFQTPLAYAAMKGRVEVIRVLVEANASVDQCMPTPLMRAAIAGHEKAIRTLLEAVVKQYGGGI